MQVKTVSIATGSETRLDESPAVVDVISREEISLMAAETVFDVLETITGLHVYPSKINRLNPVFSIRGMDIGENAQVLLLINGQRQFRVYNGGRWNLFNIGVDLIERIEVIRGPNSALYGADAFLGVINIITLGVESEKATLFGARTGSFNTQSLWYSTTEKLGDVKYSVSGQWRNTDGDSSRVIDSDYANAIGLDHISLTPRALDTDLETIDLHVQMQHEGSTLHLNYVKNDGGTGAGGAQALSDGDIDIVQGYTAKFNQLWQITPKLTIDWQSFYQHYNEYIRFVLLPPGFVAPNGFDEQGQPTGFVEYVDGMIGMPMARERIYGSKVVVQHQIDSEKRFRFELGLRNEGQSPREKKNFGPGIVDKTTTVMTDDVVDISDTPYVYSSKRDRDSHFIMLQYEQTIGEYWDVIIGSRLDSYSDFGSSFNPRVGSVWQLNQQLSAKLLYGEAFRPPSFSELYSINNPVVIGNPELKSEKVKMTEFNLDYRLNDFWQFNLVLFDYNASNIIDWVAQDQGPAIADNVKSIEGHGIEFESIWKPNTSWYVKFGYVWQQVEDVDVRHPVADAPSQSLDFMINWQLSSAVNLRMDNHWIADRAREYQDERDPVDDYVLSNLSINYQYDEAIAISFSVKNLFDVKAKTPAQSVVKNDYPVASRGLWLDASYKF